MKCVFITTMQLIHAMPEENLTSTLPYQITLANGQSWNFCPTDPESFDAVSRLALIMDLNHGQSGQTIYIATNKNKGEYPAIPHPNLPSICILPIGYNEDLKFIQTCNLARFLAFQALPHGGLLIHGALIERDGIGVILAAPGGTGKTTASNRVREPWRSLSDDATIIVKNSTGDYYAHPWPTWSRFFENGPGGRWHVERAVRLKGLFFLNRAEENSVKPLDVPEAIAYLMESVNSMLHPLSRHPKEKKEIEEIYKLELHAVHVLTQFVPVYTLNISLEGPFWEEIDGVLKVGDGEKTLSYEQVSERSTELKAALSGQQIDDNAIPIIYSGPSMNPTLSEPDLLEVVPVKKSELKIGDVICYFSPDKGINVVHRIIRLTKDGYITKGDNNLHPDTQEITYENILGKVKTAWKPHNAREIISGRAGYIHHITLQMKKRTWYQCMRGVHIIKPVLRICKPVIHQRIYKIAPRVVIFQNRRNNISKLFYKSAVIGEYNLRTGSWSIAFPYNLIIDYSQLPRFVPSQSLTSKKGH